MTKLVMHRGKLLANAGTILPNLHRRLSSIGRPLVESALDAQREITQFDRLGSTDLAANRGSNPRALWGEIFVCDNEYYVVTVQQDDDRPLFRFPGSRDVVEGKLLEGAEIRLSAITPNDEPKALDAFVEAVRESLGGQLEPYRYETDKFDRLREQASEEFPLPAPTEIAQAHVLTTPDARSLAISIKQAGGILRADLGKQLKDLTADQVEAVQAELIEAGIINQELVVTCKSSSRQVFRVTSNEAIEAIAATNARCACGRRIDQERIEQAVGITDAGEALLNKSRWLSVVVYDELVRAGVDPGRIMIEAHLGGDEVDCIADISGEITLFELKDKEFNLREAYSFGAKIGIIRPRHAVIVTSAHVGGDARQHLARALGDADEDESIMSALSRWHSTSSRNIRYIEGGMNIQTEIKGIVSEIEERDAEGLLQLVLNIQRVGPAELIEAINRLTPA